MQSDTDLGFEKISRQLTKIRWVLMWSTFGVLALQLLVFVLLMSVVRDTAREDSANWENRYRVGYFSSNEQKMADDLEQKMLLGFAKVQDQIAELKVHE